MGDTQAPESPDVADSIGVADSISVHQREDPDVAITDTMGGTQAPTSPDVADSIGVAHSISVQQREDFEERRLQIMKGDVTLVVTIRKGKRIGLEAVANVETDVQAIFKRARKELHTVTSVV